MAEAVTGRVLITGHRGYVGSVLCPALAAAGWQLVGADIDLYAACAVAAQPASAPCPISDFRDYQSSDLEGFDAIVHLAGLSNDPLGELDPSLTHP